MSAPSSSSLTPAQIRHAYGVDQIAFAGLPGDGTGQTIAVVDAYGYPTALADLQAFDQQFGLADPPSFQEVNQRGIAGALPVSNAQWNKEAALDVQWAHATAPKANIILVACDSASSTDLDAAVDWARTQPGVVAVSMSYGLPETSFTLAGQLAEDSHYITPSGHPGVTFLAATGDSGTPGTYPAYSPNVVAVGGTTLSLSNGNYGSESSWASSGGGLSIYEPRPSWQSGFVTQSYRAIPDVAMNADPGSGVAVYYGGSWYQYGGTSLACPMWAGLVAVADQARSMAGLTSLDGPSQVLPALYQLPSTNFHDITTGGSNGYSPAVGYDFVTGRGTPVANLLVPALAGVGSVSGAVYQDDNSDGVKSATDAGLAGVHLFLDANGNGVYDTGGIATPSSTVVTNIPDADTGGATSTLRVSGYSKPITDVNITFNITHPRDRDLTGYLIAPDGTSATLFSARSGVNFTSTTMDDQATLALVSSGSPYTGSFTTGSALSAFNGKSANGTWSFKVVDSTAGNVGSIQSWSLAITTSPSEPTAVADSAGSYAIMAPSGTDLIRQVIPANYVQTSPAGGAPLSVAVAGTARVSGQNLGDFATVFADAAGGAAYYVSLDSSGANLQVSRGTAPQTVPAFQVPLAALPGLSFNLTGAGDVLAVSYANGSPIPAGGLAFTGGGTGELRVIGQSPTQAFTMSNTQFTLGTGPALTYTLAGTLTLFNGAFNYTGDWSTIGVLSLNTGASFNW